VIGITYEQFNTRQPTLSGINAKCGFPVTTVKGAKASESSRPFVKTHLIDGQTLILWLLREDDQWLNGEVLAGFGK